MSFTLAAAPAAVQSELEQAVHERIRAAAGRGTRALVVDDDPEVLRLMCTALERDGLAIAAAGDGARALEIVNEADPIDLIVTDLRMPRLSGVEFVRVLREQGQDLPVIFVTGFAEYNLIAEATKLQPFGFIEKPFEPQTLIDTVRNAAAHCIRNKERDIYTEVLTELVEEKTKELTFRTERLMAEKQLLQGIIGQATFGIIAADATGRVHLLNEFAAQRALANANSAPTYHGRFLRELLLPAFQDGFVELFDLALKRVAREEQTFALGNGERTLSVVAYPISFRKEVTAVVFVIHDITDRENLQRRLMQTAKLASIGELAAGVAHEINNPIGFVTSNVNTLARYWNAIEQILSQIESASGALQAAQWRKLCVELDLEYVRGDVPVLLKETEDGLSRVAKIVSDLKSFARVDNPEPEHSDVVSIVEDALNLCRSVIKYKLEVIRDYQYQGEIVCYPSQLAQVFTNLIVNAAQATAQEGKLYISVDGGPGSVTIKFRDTGSGIAPDVLPLIFDPFFTTKEPGQGSGMGLSISFGIVERHGGMITVSSEVGQGTEFAIRLPIGGALPNGPAGTGAEVLA